MLKKISLAFLFVFVFSAGTIVGSHFKKQIDHQKINLANSIQKKLKESAQAEAYEDESPDAEEDYYEEPAPKKVKKVTKKTYKKMPKKITKRSRPKPSRSRASKSSSKYTVQVASFPDSSLANEMARKLKEQGHDALVFSATVKGKRWHRVGIGSFSSIGEANKKQRQLVTDKVARGSIISKIN